MFALTFATIVPASCRLNAFTTTTVVRPAGRQAADRDERLGTATERVARHDILLVVGRGDVRGMFGLLEDKARKKGCGLVSC